MHRPDVNVDSLAVHGYSQFDGTKRLIELSIYAR